MAIDFKTLTAEADRRSKKAGANANKPFELKFANGKTIAIKAPDATTYLAMSNIDQQNYLELFQTLFGNNMKDWNTFVEEIDGQPVAILNIILEEAFSFWGAEVPTGKSEG